MNRWRNHSGRRSAWASRHVVAVGSLFLLSVALGWTVVVSQRGNEPLALPRSTVAARTPTPPPRSVPSTPRVAATGDEMVAGPWPTAGDVADAARCAPPAPALTSLLNPGLVPSLERDWSGTAGTVVTARDAATQANLPVPTFDGRGAFYALTLSIAPDDHANLQDLSLVFWSDTGRSFLSWLSPQTDVRPGMNLVRVPHSDIGPRDGATEEDWASISSVQFRVTPRPGSQIDVTLHDLSYGRPNGPGAVTFTFDDGFASTLTAAVPAMDVFQFRGVAFVATGQQVGKPGHLSLNDLRMLHEKGWDIGSHTVTHEDLTEIPDKVSDELELSQRYLLEHELARGVRFFATPSGRYTEEALPAIRRYYDIHRTTRWGLETMPPVNPLELRSLATATYVTLDRLKGLVDRVAEHNEWLIINVHDLVDGLPTDIEWNASDFRALVEYVANRNVRVATFSDLFCAGARGDG